MCTESPGAEPTLVDSPPTPAATEPTTALATDPTAKLSAEIARLRVDNDDLRASAALWSRLYDGAIQRATELEAQLAGSQSYAPPDAS
jgi:hypothetical protein